ncbi:protein GrpE [Nitrosomonas stercoris]|uniref:Protein GrpE n=1 Tax=Nitrosomonas stercoris TaxID=1444684 RepID=A0A4Y1YPP8_9PROT|nr:protein GrpE [Nitrosomonas stercoris]
MQESHNQKPIDEQNLSETEETLTTQHADVSTENTENVEHEQEVASSLEQRLEQAEAKATEYQDAWLRAKAETENMRKRAQADITNAHKYAIDKFATELLAVMDSLDAALAVENCTVESLKDGVTLTRKQLVTIFEKFNVHSIDPQGEKFDPHQHEAMCEVESDLPAKTVAQVMQKGYRLNDRVIRPAMVAVSKTKST